jgi:hypothetical protein
MGRERMRRALLTALISSALLAACAPSLSDSVKAALTATAASLSDVTNELSATSTAVPPRRVQPTAPPVRYGPESADFPTEINPMTGLPVLDPELLKIPAVLVSISHFPAAGRPQAGLSFAPFVYEFSITNGESRFLAAFYGQFTQSEVPIIGDCAIRRGAFTAAGTLIGNRVWLDANADGKQDVGEVGIPGICVTLRDGQGRLLAKTTTDTNGMYGFGVQTGNSYQIEFKAPPYLEFTRRDVGFEDSDSDVDPASGSTGSFAASADDLDWDAGLILSGAALPASLAQATPAPSELGPVRSGRLLYAYLAASYSDSCLIYAFASPEILEKLPHCAFVSHEEANGGEMISTERMRAVAEDMMRRTANRPFDYSSNVYAGLPPAGGLPASRLNVFFGNINQSGWLYDPLYQSYLRYVDNADVKALGVLHPEVDRLTGRQLHFENVIVIMADTDVVTRSNLDIHLEGGNTGRAMLFRDGRLYSITWSTRGGAYEKRTGLRKPIQFLNPDGSPAALKPGHTWIVIVTPFSEFGPRGGGSYTIKYGPPAGEAQ